MPSTRFSAEAARSLAAARSVESFSTVARAEASAVSFFAASRCSDSRALTALSGSASPVAAARAARVSSFMGVPRELEAREAPGARIGARVGAALAAAVISASRAW